MMRSTMTLAVGLGFLAGVAEAQAAPRPSVWIGSDIAMASRFTDQVDFNAAKVQASGYTGGFSLPFMWAQGRTLLFAGASYRMRQFHSTNLPVGPENRPAELHEVAGDVMLRRAVGERWAVIVRAAAGLASDFVGKVDVEEALRYQGAVLVTRLFSPRLTMGMGATYGNTLSFDFPLPLVHVEWTDGRRWRVGGTLPADVAAWYSARRGLDIGLRGAFEGATYTTGRLFPGDEPRLQYVAGRVGPSVRWQLNTVLALAVDVGGTWQMARLYDGPDEVGGAVYDLRPTFFTATRLHVTF